MFYWKESINQYLLFIQSAQIDRIHETAAGTTENVKGGNEQIREVQCNIIMGRGFSKSWLLAVYCLLRDLFLPCLGCKQGQVHGFHLTAPFLGQWPITPLADVYGRSFQNPCIWLLEIISRDTILTGELQLKKFQEKIFDKI